VPSLPTMSFLIISTGSSGEISTKAFIAYPVVHLIENFLLIKAVSSSSAWTSLASADTPSHKAFPKGDSCWKTLRLSGSDVSKTVASWSPNTTRKSLSVWYVFWATPQHMPLELLFTMPPACVTCETSIEATPYV
jgi:hypothetical protein